MKRVLIVATTSYAGMGPYVSEIVNNFNDSDEVFFLLRDYDDDFFKKNVKEDLVNRCSFYKRSNSNWNKLKDMVTGGDLSYEKLILKKCEELDVKVVHFINGPGSVRLMKRLKEKGIVSLSTVHDLHPHEAKKALHKMVRQNIRIWRENRSIKYSDCLLTNVAVQYDELKQLFPQKKVFFHEFPSLVTSEIEKGAVVPNELKHLTEPYILFFGRIEAYKGVPLLLDAFFSCDEINRDYNLVIAGSGNLSYSCPKTEKLILMNRYVEDAEIKYLYEHARCVVYPYISATQSGVLSLSFYFKTPTLASDIPFFKNIIETYRAGYLFKKGNVDDLVDKLKRVLNENVEETCKRALDYYAKFYEKGAIREQLLTIYDATDAT